MLSHRVNRRTTTMALTMVGAAKKRAERVDEVERLLHVVEEEMQNTNPMLYVAPYWKSSKRKRIATGQC